MTKPSFFKVSDHERYQSRVDPCFHGYIKSNIIIEYEVGLPTELVEILFQKILVVSYADPRT